MRIMTNVIEGMELRMGWSLETSLFGVRAAIWIVVLSFLCKLWRNHPLYGKNQGAKVYPLLGNLIEFTWNHRRIYDLTVDYMRDRQISTMRCVVPGCPTTFFTSSPENVEHILKTKFENYPKGELIRNVMHDVLGDGILNADGEVWRMQRKIANSEFSMRSSRNRMLENVQEEIEIRLLPILSLACDQERTLDLQEILKKFAFDINVKMTVGVDLGCLAYSLRKLEVEQAFDDATALVSSRFMNLMWRVFRALNILGERRLREAAAQIRSFLMPVIRQRRKEMQSGDGSSKSHRVDLLSRFLQHGEEEPERLSDEFLCSILVSFLLAGRDAVATALTWFFWTLTNNRRVEKNIRAEISRIVTSRRTPNSKDGERKHFTFDELKSMHYLQAALYESMRMNAPVPGDLKVARNDDVLPDGTRIRKEDFVGFHPYAMGRLEALWGPDCLEYKPERWLKDGVFVPESSFKFPVFQAGPRMCLGKEVAVMQMKLMVATILDQFSVSVPVGFKPVYKQSFVLAMADGLPVLVHRI